MKTLILLFWTVLASVAFATDNLNLPLRGQGQFKWYFLDIYEAKLWSEKAEDIYSKPLVLELKYQRNFKGKDIAEQSVKELALAGTISNELKVWKEKLEEIFPDVKPGDTITARYHPEKGVSFHLNSVKELGKLADIGSSKKFLDIWLGEKTSAPELRKKLLGYN